MRKLLVFCSMVAMAALVALNLNSCSSDDPIPMPTVKIDVQKDGHKVIIAVQATDATSFSWNYGNGETSTNNGTSHEYEYEYSGTYTISVTVTNESGSASDSEEVIIDPEPVEILSGTPQSHPNGKTWLLDPTYYPGKNGAGPIIPALTVTQDFLMDNILELLLGLGTEYDNEFTFKYDGSLMIDNKNAISLGSAMYAGINQIAPAPGLEGGMGLMGIPYTPAANGTWELKVEDVNMDVVIEDPNDLGAGWTEGTFEKADQMILVPSDYFGFLGVTKTVLIKEITSEYMHVMFFMHGVVEVPMKPSTAIHVTFVPKQ
ncbi:PKD domain-containing protein [Prolixibacteraceae bacterium Z1-6]|uniref:PKD domain-containing protein n=1 Tax=Draconibacterium aestuarii TaxID=2998507 RepID=A0A9X3F1J0_9BACT|nr:PKD domain-containing protein [Prolixibacteraceae bacterium Z1-6]